MRRSTKFLLAATLAVAVSSCTTTPPPGEPAPGQAAFQGTVKPLLEHRCVHCHSNTKPIAGLNFQDREATLDPAKRFIVAGHPDDSRLYRAVTLEGAHPRVMPGDGWGITSDQKAAIKTWISEGAPWPEGRAGRIKKRTYKVDMEDYL